MENTVTCAREDCDVVVERKTHNQKYCSDECCRIATNARIMQKYYERRAQRRGEVRYCSSCAVTKLSRYNTETTCSACQEKRKDNMNESVKNLVHAIAWDE